MFKKLIMQVVLVTGLGGVSMGQDVVIDDFEAGQLRGWRGATHLWIAGKGPASDKDAEARLSLNHDGRYVRQGTSSLHITYSSPNLGNKYYAHLQKRGVANPGRADTFSFWIYKATDEVCPLRIYLTNAFGPKWRNVGYNTKLDFTGWWKIDVHRALFSSRPGFEWAKINHVELVFMDPIEAYVDEVRFETGEAAGRSTAPAAMASA